ncbi:hypothetical protein QBC34DRAFT_296159, partial [Podospora aff. communis PSN243]
FIHRFILRTIACDAPKDVKRLRISELALRWLLVRFEVLPSFISSLLHQDCPPRFHEFTLRGHATSHVFWYNLPIRVAVPCVEEQASHTLSQAGSNQTNPGTYLHLNDMGLDIRSSRIIVYCRKEGSTCQCVCFDFQDGRWPTLVEEPYGRMKETLQHSQSRGLCQHSASMHLTILSSSVRWWTTALSRVKEQLICHVTYRYLTNHVFVQEKGLLARMTETTLLPEGNTLKQLLETNQSLHIIVNHLRRYKTETEASIEIAVALLDLPCLWVIEPDHSQNSGGALHGVLRASLRISIQQFQGLSAMVDELEGKANTILALLFQSMKLVNDMVLINNGKAMRKMMKSAKAQQKSARLMMRESCQIAKNTRKDGVSMKALALLSAFFLPATSYAVIHSIFADLSFAPSSLALPSLSTSKNGSAENICITHSQQMDNSKDSESKMGDEPAISSPAQQVSSAFLDSKIAIAVDISGSTYGTVFKSEQEAILSICSLIPETRHSNTTIIPWSDMAGSPCPIAKIEHHLQSGGGTDPNCLLEDASCRRALQDCHFWFLMTDGEIFDDLVYAFSRNLAAHRMHTKACVISIFGKTLKRPKDCNISVGVSVFATSPHVAFLYTDVDTGRTYVLSTKGCFSTLLPPGKRNPKLNLETNWEDLPRTSYENLTRISVPETQVLGEDEIMLQGETAVVNFKSLLSDENIDESLMKQILENEDNMRTLAITAKTRGEREKFGLWLDKVDARSAGEGSGSAPSYPPPLLLRPRKFKRPQGSLKAYFTPRGEADDDYDTENETEETSDEYEDAEAPAPAPNRRNSVSTQATAAMRSIAESACGDAESVGGFINDLEEVRVPNRMPEPTPPRFGLFARAPLRISAPPLQTSGLLSSPGFLKPARPDAPDHFQGQCTKCLAPKDAGTTLALLLNPSGATTAPATKDFPPVSSSSTLVYALTMGNYPEMDIISESLFCDSCLYKKAGATGTGMTNGADVGEPAVGPLVIQPLVTYKNNKAAWLDTINIATNKRFEKSDLPAVFLAIIYTKLEKLPSSPDGHSNAQQLRAALEWEAGMIQSSANLQASPGLGTAPYQQHSGSAIIQDAVLLYFRNALIRSDSLLLHYPMDGFIVANAILSSSRHSSTISPKKRQSVVLSRFFFHLTESFHANGRPELEARASMVQSLLVDNNPSRPRSLLRWDAARARILKLKDSVMTMKTATPSTTSSLSGSYKLSLSVAELVDASLLTHQDLATFERLGELFGWIDKEGRHALCIFVHYLLRSETSESEPLACFQQLMGRDGIRRILTKAGPLDEHSVERLVRDLPDY